MLKAAIAALWLLAAAPGQELVFQQGSYYVYRETNSCALYADYSDGSMLRLSFKGTTSEAFFTYYSPKFARMPTNGSPMTFAIAVGDDLNNLRGYTGTVISNGRQNGLNTSGGIELVEILQGAETLHLYGEGMIEIARLDVRGIDPALKRLKLCGQDR